MLGKLLCCVTVWNYLVLVGVNAFLTLDRDSHRFPFNRDLYENVVDPELCRQQLTYIRTDFVLLARFLDAGIRIPRGLLMGNLLDYGNFHQCLAINEAIEDMTITGKYCRIQIPVNQNFHLPNKLEKFDWNFDLSSFHVNEKLLKRLEEANFQKAALETGLAGFNTIKRETESPSTNVSFNLAICIPRPCSTEQAINGLLFNLTNIGFEYNEEMCRLPDDRPWVAADYVAIVVFSMLGALTIISTGYDIYQCVFLKKGQKDINPMLTSFSVYTNTRRLLTFNSSPGSLECLDGIRALAMVWVILGHSFSSIGDTSNPIENVQWAISKQAAWVTVGTLTVDTFFFLSGLLLVFTTVGKIKSMQLLKNLHVFYLNRLLRMFPILAAVILFQASFYLRMFDGPRLDRIGEQVFKCREFWWTTLLHIQNFLNPLEACIEVAWYLGIDVQLHILSPLVLFWVLSSRRAAWTALHTSLLAVIAASTLYVFFENFPSSALLLTRQDELQHYFANFYMNILTRASPFFVGMVYGYLIYLLKKGEVYVPKSLSVILLLCSLTLLLVVMYCTVIAMALDWDNQLADNFFNAFLRPLWGLGLGWIIFACIQGVAEPINWFLSLRIWKLPARISYAMYLTHYPIMYLFYSTVSAPPYFSVPAIMFNFAAFVALTLVVSFFVTLLIDSPFSTIFKRILGSPKQSKENKVSIEEQSLAKRNGIDNNGFIVEGNKTLQALDSNAANEELKLHIQVESEKL